VDVVGGPVGVGFPEPGEVESAGGWVCAMTPPTPPGIEATGTVFGIPPIGGIGGTVLTGGMSEGSDCCVPGPTGGLPPAMTEGAEVEVTPGFKPRPEA
jgi:hypothetical protein